jgi:hypothetical protein
MKRLVSKSERERGAKRKQIIIGIALVFLMVLSVLGFALRGNTGSQEDEDKIIYNEFEFTYINGFWRIGDFAFRYNPEQVPEIGFGLRDATFYQGFPAYVYSENDGAEAEIKMNLELIAQRVQKACIDEERIECSEKLPVKTCEDNFIIIRESNNSRITQDNNCVYIEGPKEELLGLVDQFLFKILGIK